MSQEGEVQVHRTTTLQIERCYTCGRYWGAERVGGPTVCPRCAGERIRGAIEEAESLRRTVAGLKGALARRRGT